MIRISKLILLLSSIMISMCQKVEAQDYIPVNDSLKDVMQQQLDQTVFYKKGAVYANEEDVIKIMDDLPAFGVYNETYFVTGVPLNTTINRNTADAMFQISIRHRLTKSWLPFNTFLFLTYSQKSFWDIYADSAPFKDNNYNPSLGLGKIIVHNNRFKGGVFLQIEHESNGKSSDDSRSWNMISLSSKYYYNLQFALNAKLWIPIVDGGENKDIVDYRGIGTLSADYSTKDRKWWLTAELNPRKGFGNVNTVLTAAFKVSKKSNQYIYARFYNGKGENLLDYNKYDINFRVGFCIKPNFVGVF